jgi:hypothetical protein
MLLKRCNSLCCRRLLAREGIELRPEFLPLHEAVGRQVLVGASLALNLVDPIRERPCLFLEDPPQRPVKLSRVGKPFHVDIWVERNGEVLAIELKYKTKALQTSERGEEFVLQNHSAQDIARYDFIKDVWRVETIVANYTHASGYAILLTNDPS